MAPSLRHGVTVEDLDRGHGVQGESSPSGTYDPVVDPHGDDREGQQDRDQGADDRSCEPTECRAVRRSVGDPDDEGEPEGEGDDGERGREVLAVGDVGAVVPLGPVLPRHAPRVAGGRSGRG